jgi:hypothetical protein
VFLLVVVVGFFVCVNFYEICCGFVFCVGLFFGFCLVVVVVVEAFFFNMMWSVISTGGDLKVIEFDQLIFFV